MDNAQSQLWFVTGEIDDYFRRLGCAGYQPGYQNWHVAALVLLALKHRDPFEQQSFELAVRDSISDWMWDHTNGLPARVMRLITSLNVSARDLERYTGDIALRRSFRDGTNERQGWEHFSMQLSDAMTKKLAA